MESGKSLKTAAASLAGPKLCLDKAKILSHILSDKNYRGLDLSCLMSKEAPDFKNTPISPEEIFPAVVWILKHIINKKAVLSHSKSPLFTYLYTWKVYSSIIFSTLLEGS